MHAFDALTPMEEALEHAGHAGARGQDSLHCVQQLQRVAPAAIAGRERAVRLGAVRGAPGVLQPGGARLRVGADAAGLAENVGALVWSPLGWGRLTGKIRRGQPAGEGHAAGRRRRGWRARSWTTNTCSRWWTRWTSWPAETGKTVPQLALAWLLRKPTVSSLIVGARNEGAAAGEPGGGGDPR